jgi:hypothetical protein
MISVVDIEKDIQRMVDSDEDYLDAILEYAERNDIEVETISKIIKKNSNLLTKLTLQAEDLNYIEKKNRLPI